MKIIVALLNLAFSLTILLLSLRIISSSIQSAMGSQLRKILSLFTFNVVISVFSGMFVTAVVQSSTAVAVIMIALVDAEVINIKQAFGVILGANIGTTITAQIVSLDLSQLAIPIMICGLFLLPWNHKSKIIGTVIVGFGGVFIGLGLIKLSLLPMLELGSVTRILTGANNSVLFGFLIGLVLTALIQSSSAVTSIVIVLAQANGIMLPGAIAIALGSNVGTVTTTLLSSLGLRSEAKATAYADLLFNVLGVLILLPFFNHFVTLVTLTADNPGRQIANAHTLFNLITAVCALPAIDILEKITCNWAGISYSKEK